MLVPINCHFIFDITDLQQYDNIYIYKTDKNIDDIEKYIEYFSGIAPVEVVSISDLNAIDNSAFLLIASYEWPVIREKVIAEGIQDCRLLVLITPGVNGWNYGCVMRSIRDIEFEDRPVKLRPEHLQHHAKQHAGWDIDGNNIDIRNYDSLPVLRKCLEDETARQDILRFIKRLSDDESIKVVQDLFFSPPMNLVERFCKNVMHHVQYIDIINVNSGDVILNGGIQDGFELPYFIAKSRGEAKIVNVDPIGNDALREYAKPTVDYFGANFVHVRKALWDKTGVVSLPKIKGDVFSAVVLSQFIGMKSDEWEHEDFPAITIDDLWDELSLKRMDLLKLDVEGAEPKVLVGGMKTIKTYRPQLAISIYHEPWHQFAIPNFLMDNLEGYHWYIRHYSYARWETILYGVPQERIS